MGVLTLDLQPGKSLGAFSLGMPVCEALAYVELHQATFETLEVKYSDEDPFKWDLVLNFPVSGFHLRFEPTFQRLRLIEVYDLTRVRLRYAASVIGGQHQTATFAHTYTVFGPTLQGVYNEGRGLYTLSYPGLSLEFPIPVQYAEACRQLEAELPLEFRDGTTPVLSRVRVWAGSGAHSPPPPLPPSISYMEPVHAKLGEGLFFPAIGRSLLFGASPQDAWSELGTPGDILEKQAVPMVIHSASEQRLRMGLGGDVFYNYFTKGLDVLFDGQTKRIKKFVLHTNFPGHVDFNVYIKCNFVIHPEVISEQGGVITSDSKWEQIQNIMGDAGRPAIQTTGSKNNPFGPTFVYGYKHMSVEVTKNGHITSVTLFKGC